MIPCDGNCICYPHFPFTVSANNCNFITKCNVVNVITKLHESGNLYSNITEFGVAEGSPEPAWRRWSTATPNKLILPYRSPDEGCLVFISYCLMILFTAKINMYLLLYLSFKIKVKEYTQLHYNAVLFMWCYNYLWHHNRLNCEIIMSFDCYVMISSFCVLLLFRT